MRRIWALCAVLAFLGGCAGSRPTAHGHVALPQSQEHVREVPKAPVAKAAVAPARVYYRNMVVVLMYHGLGPKAHGDYVTPGMFSGEMAALQKAGFSFVSLSQVAAFLQGGSLPPNAVALTFDDGLESVYTYAYPVLLKDRIPFAGFLIAGRVGRYTGTLSWAQVKAMVKSGLFTVGSHTLSSHDAVPTGPRQTGPALVAHIYNPQTRTTETDDQFRSRVEADLSKSRNVLQLESGQNVQWFAYPFGAYDPEVEQLLSSAGYRFALLARWGWAVTRDARPLTLPRINAGTANNTPQNIASTVEYVASLASRKPSALPPASYTPSWP